MMAARVVDSDSVTALEDSWEDADTADGEPPRVDETALGEYDDAALWAPSVRRKSTDASHERKESKRTAVRRQRLQKNQTALRLDRRKALLSAQGGSGLLANSFGKLHFPEGQESQFMRVDQQWAEQNPASVLRIMLQSWGLRPPSLVLSVTGGALDFDLPSELDRVLKEGLWKAAHFSRAWVVTGGSDSGVMKLVGDALSLDAIHLVDSVHRQPHPVPVIGICTWNMIVDHHLLEDANGETVRYEPKDGQSLNPNHTHFIMVDHHKQAWGGEIDFRAKLQDAIVAASSSDGKPTLDALLRSSCVCVVVQGGPNTLKTAKESIQQQAPLVIIKGSGGAADVLALAYELLEPGKDCLSEQACETVIASITRWQPNKDPTPTMEQIVAILKTPHMIVVYDHHDGGLHDAVFDAIIQMESHEQAADGEIESMERLRRIELALTWNRADVAERELQLYTPPSKAVLGTFEKNEDANPLHWLLKWSLIRHRTDFVRMLIKNSYVDLGGFLTATPCRFYDQFRAGRVTRGQLMRQQGVNEQYDPWPIDASQVELPGILVDAVFVLAEHEHECWLKKKILAGWSYATHGQEAARRFVPWVHLHPDDKDYRVQQALTTFQSVVLQGYHFVPRENKPPLRGLKERVEQDDSRLEITERHPSISPWQPWTPQPFRLAHDQAMLEELLLHKAALNKVAEDAHDVWVRRRLDNGWLCGPFSEYNKRHPALKPFSELNPADSHENDKRQDAEDFGRRLLYLMHALGFEMMESNNCQDLYWRTHARYDFRDHLFQHDCSAIAVQSRLEKLMQCETVSLPKHDRYSLKEAQEAYLTHLSPAFELMVWAIFVNRHDIAELMWRQGPHWLFRALFAQRLNRSLAQSMEDLALPEIQARMLDSARIFGEHAYAILQRCGHVDSSLTAPILLRKHPYAGGMNTVTLAYLADNKDVIAHTSFKTVLKLQWKQGLVPHQNSAFKVLLALFVPMFVPLFVSVQGYPLRWNKQKGHHKALLVKDKDKDDEHGSLSHHGSFKDQEAIPIKLTYVGAIAQYFRTPLTAYWFDVVAFLALLAFYSYVAVRPFEERTISTSEIILACWMFTLLLDEVRQVVVTGVRGWLKSPWNRIDFVIHGLFVSGFALRFFPDYVLDSKTVYALNTILLYARVLRLYAFSSYLGPKMLMVTHMIGDIVVFLALILVFLLSFGIALHALVFPTQDYGFFTFTSIIYRPFFQIFGELFLEEIQDETVCIGDSFTQCGRSTAYLVPILIGIYLLVTNVMLINLLIAIMSDTYQNLSSDQEKVWCCQNFELLAEYKDLQFSDALPPPFNVLRNFQLLFGAIFKLKFNTKDHPEMKWGQLQRHCRARPDRTPLSHKPKAVRKQEGFEARQAEAHFNEAELSEKQDVSLWDLQASLKDLYRVVIEQQAAIDEILKGTGGGGNALA